MELYNTNVLVPYIIFVIPQPDPSLFCCFSSPPPPPFLLAMLQASLVEPNSHPTNQHARLNGHRPVTSTSPQPNDPPIPPRTYSQRPGVANGSVPSSGASSTSSLSSASSHSHPPPPSGASTCWISSLISCLAKEALAR